MSKLLYGVGINDSLAPVSLINEDGARVYKPCYEKWKSMLTRCYSKKTKERQPCYLSANVCDEWLRYSNFKNWIDNQPIYNLGDCVLDKDILGDGSGIYSPDTCCLVPQSLNNFMVNSLDFKSLKTGVSFVKIRRKFRAQCKNPMTSRNETLGYFDSAEKASRAWRERKAEISILLSNQQPDSRVKNRLVEYANQLRKGEGDD